MQKAPKTKWKKAKNKRIFKDTILTLFKSHFGSKALIYNRDILQWSKNTECFLYSFEMSPFIICYVLPQIYFWTHATSLFMVLFNNWEFKYPPIILLFQYSLKYFSRWNLEATCKIKKTNPAEVLIKTSVNLCITELSSLITLVFYFTPQSFNFKMT